MTSQGWSTTPCDEAHALRRARRARLDAATLSVIGRAANQVPDDRRRAPSRTRSPTGEE